MMPARKWWAAQVTALTALAVMYATTGAWDQEETIAAIGLVSQAALSWLVPNQERSSWGDGERGMALVEALVIVFLLLVILVVLFRLL